jgi:hypothetical protein
LIQAFADGKPVIITLCDVLMGLLDAAKCLGKLKEAELRASLKAVWDRAPLGSTLLCVDVDDVRPSAQDAKAKVVDWFGVPAAMYSNVWINGFAAATVLYAAVWQRL